MKLNKNININNKYSIMIILMLTPIIDIIYTVNYHIINFKVPIHLVLRMIILLYILFNIRYKNHIKYLLILSMILVCGFIYPKIMGYPFSFIDNLSYSMKIVNMIASGMYFFEVLKNKVVDEDYFIKCINLSTIIIGASIVFSNIFNIGLKTYLDKPISGYKGFFVIHNSITAVLLIVIPINFLYFLKKKNKYIFILLLLNIVAVMQIGTKSGMIGAAFEIIVSLMYFIFYYGVPYNIKNLNKRVIKILLIILILFFIVSVSFVNNFINKQKENFKHTGYSNFISYILSNRDLQIKYINEEIKNNLNHNPKYFFGMGVKYANKVVNEGKKEFEIIEMDFEGIKIYSGYLAFIVISIFLLDTIINILISIKKGKKITNKVFVLLAIFMGLVHAAFGGHVLYEGITGTYLGAVIGLSRFYSDDASKIKILSKFIGSN